MSKWRYLGLILTLVSSLTACDAIEAAKREVEEQRQAKEQAKQEFARIFQVEQELQKAVADEEYEQALPLAREIWQLCAKLFGPDSPQTKEAKNLLVKLNEAGQIENELSQIERIQELAQEYHSRVDQNEYDKALPLLQELHTLLCKVEGPEADDTQKTAVALENLKALVAQRASAKSTSSGEGDSAQIGESPEWLNRLIPTEYEELERLVKDYQDLDGQGRYAEALVPATRLAAIVQDRAGGDHPNYAASLNNLAVLYHEMGDYAKAEPLYLQAMEIRKRALGEDHPDYAASLNNLAMLYVAMGDYSKAEPLYLQAMEISKRALGGDHPNYAASLNNLAMLYHEMGDYAKAELLYLQAMDIRKRALGEDHPNYAASLNSLAVLYRNMGDYSKAELLYLQAMDIRKHALGEDHPDYADSLNNLAVLYRNMGDYSKAELLYLQAMDIRKHALGEDHPDYATSLNNLAILYSVMGDYSKAEPLYLQAMDIRKHSLGEDHPEHAASLNNLALLYSEMDDYSKAEPLYLQALDMKKHALGEDHPDYAASLYNLAKLYQEMGDYSKAELLHLQAMDIRKRALGESHPDYAASLGNLAFLKAEIGDHATAHHLYQQAFDVHHQILNSVLGFASQQQALAYVASSWRPSAAFLGHTVQYPEAVDGARVDAMNAWFIQKGILLETHRRFQDALRLSGDSEALAVADEMASTRTALANLMQSGPGQMAPDAYRDRLDTLRAETEVLEKQLIRLSAAYAAQVEVREADCDAVAQALPKDTVLVEMANIGWADFKAQTGRSSGRHYVFFVLHAGAPEALVMEDLGDAKPIDEAVAEVRALVEKMDSVALSKASRELYGRAFDDLESLEQAKVCALVRKRDEPALKQALQDLYDLIFAKIAPHLNGRTKVFLSPDGDLNLIPFEIMVDEEGRYLVDSYEFNYISAGRDIVGYALNEELPKDGPLVVGDPDFDLGVEARQAAIEALNLNATENRAYVPTQDTRMRFTALPGARQEAKEIASLLKGMNPEVRIGDEAVEEALLAADAPRYVHLATHGFFLEDERRETGSDRGVAGLIPVGGMDSMTSLGGMSMAMAGPVRNPLVRSGVAMAGANVGRGEDGEGTDGLFTAAEFLNMRLRGTELVTLSACETGLGDVQTGEGVFGLRRAVTMAGARSLVMSLWSVPDVETREMMVRFYKNMLEQETPNRRKALRDAVLAQRELTKERYGHTHPYYWGAFVFMGSAD